jgi:hypothetical protein
MPDLGLMRWVARKIAPSRMQRPPTTMYAMPRKGFLPPMTVRVEMRIDLVPLYALTGKPARS